MKKISAEIIADSINKQGDRITSMVLTFPRFILAELNTHRVFSRNSASSRAIPFKKMVEMVDTDPFIPYAWQKDHKGMQGTEYFNLDELITSEGHTRSQVTVESWLNARDEAINYATDLNENGVTKQLCNRLLEPFMWHTCIITATEFDNFFELRCPQYPKSKVEDDGEITTEYKKSRKDWIDSCGYPNNTYLNIKDERIKLNDVISFNWLQFNEGLSEIHMMELAECMWDAMNKSVPNRLQPGNWHIPFGNNITDKKVREYYLNRKENPIDVSLNSNYTEKELDRENPYSSTHYFDKYYLPLAKKIATARCARVSYLNYEGKDDYESDIKLYDKLLKSAHMSPFEHVARCMTDEEYEVFGHRNNKKGEYYEYNYYCPENGDVIVDSYIDHGWCKNFKGFVQLRENLK